MPKMRELKLLLRRRIDQLEPTIIKDVSIDSELVKRETFGPVASIIKLII